MEWIKYNEYIPKESGSYLVIREDPSGSLIQELARFCVTHKDWYMLHVHKDRSGDTLKGTPLRGSVVMYKKPYPKDHKDEN